MNTPCKECNRIHWETLCAWIARDFETMRHLHNAELDHKETCEVIHSTWYKSLWQNAQIGRDIYQAEYTIQI